MTRRKAAPGRRSGQPSVRRGGAASPTDRQATRGGRPAAARRRGLGGEQVEGRQAVRELLRAQRRAVREVWVAEAMDDAAVLAEILDLAAAARVPVRTVARPRLDAAALSDAPQGVVAFAAPLPEVDLDHLAAAQAAFLVVLDGVTDPHHLGAVLRAAEVAGATGAVLARHRSAHVTPTAAKAAAGAIEHLPIAVTAGIPAALLSLRSAGVWVAGLDPEGTVPVYDLPIADQRLALVVGAEGPGLGRLTADRCDVLTCIPRYGRLESLSVSTAAAVALFAVARQRAGSSP